MSKRNLFIPHTWRAVASAVVVLALTCIHAQSQDRSPDPAEVENEKGEIAWQPFTSELLKRESSSGKNILLVVVADWCAPCRHHLKTLKSESVMELIREKRVTLLIADITTRSAEVKALMEEFKVKAVPTTIIYPASKPDDHTLHLGTIKETSLVELLTKLPVSMQTIRK